MSPTDAEIDAAKEIGRLTGAVEALQAQQKSTIAEVHEFGRQAVTAVSRGSCEAIRKECAAGVVNEIRGQVGVLGKGLAEKIEKHHATEPQSGKKFGWLQVAAVLLPIILSIIGSAFVLGSQIGSMRAMLEVKTGSIPAPGVPVAIDRTDIPGGG